MDFYFLIYDFNKSSSFFCIEKNFNGEIRVGKHLLTSCMKHLLWSKDKFLLNIELFLLSTIMVKDMAQLVPYLLLLLFLFWPNWTQQ